jgi:hypothetical protein
MGGHGVRTFLAQMVIKVAGVLRLRATRSAQDDGLGFMPLVMSKRTGVGAFGGFLRGYPLPCHVGTLSQ